VDIVTILFIALGLAMDAFAVSIAHGIAMRGVRLNGALKMAVSFGSFQAFMPLLGSGAGVSFRDFISGIDHWAAFGLLSLIGGKMIYESSRMRSSEEKPKSLKVTALLILSIATSVDALAVGLSFSFLRMSIATPIIIIGIVTFLLSFIGVSFGSKLGHFFENKIEVVGGLVLIVIGTKILAEHLV
jgi:putative Mn2+ efflux pump MntP